MAISGLTRTGNSRNNSLYGAAGEDTLDGGAGNDYLRGYGGDDVLTGGTGADRFVFERTRLANGLDNITDFEVGVDVLDFSLVGFGRGVLSQAQSNWLRVLKTDGGLSLQLDLDGGGNSFETWVNLEGEFAAGEVLNLQIGNRAVAAVVQGNPIGGRLNTTVLTYDIGNGDRNGDGFVNLADGEDNDSDFDDTLLTANPPPPYEPFDYSAYFLIGDRVRGLTVVDEFVPGVTQLSVPSYLTVTGADDAVDDGQFEVLYGTYVNDIFTVTSTPEYTRNPTTATHTMIVYDNDTTPEQVMHVGGVVFAGVYAEDQWYIANAGTPNATLNYDADGLMVPGAGPMGSPGDARSEENVIYGTTANDNLDGGSGIDILYGGAGSDRLTGGYTGDTGPADGNDWLYGDAGADVFLFTNHLAGGIDVIKDFNGSEGDVIFMLPAPDDMYNSNVAQWADTPFSIISANVTNNSGNLVQDFGSTSFTGSSSDVYLVNYANKQYLYWDSNNNGFSANDPNDVVVEVSEAVGLQTSNIYIYLD